MAQQLGEHQTAARIASLAELKPRALAKTDYLLLICSTHGDGDPPEPAVPFFEVLQSEQAPELGQLNYAVLALGDSSYEHFCTAGITLDERLAQLGAHRLLPRQDCDVDYQQSAARWLQQVVTTLAHAAGDQHTQPVVIANPSNNALAAAHTKQNPLRVEVLENICLSHRQRSLPIHHLELLLDVDNFPLAPGDAVGVMPHNPPALVAAVLDACGLSGEEAVLLNDHAMPLVQALREQVDLTIPSQNFLDYWSVTSASETLTQAAAAEAKQRREFLKQNQLLALLQAYPGTAEAQPLVDSLRPLQPRLYDVANAVDGNSDEIHLLVQAYAYTINNKKVHGIASDYLLQLQPGESVLIYPHHNKRFHLPEQTDVPIILIGWGTGVAPFRAFYQQIASSERRHECWLVFGEQSFEDDFLYQLDWQQAAAKGVLQRVDTIFIDDHPGGCLSTPLLTQLPALVDWINRDAHIYLCGDKARLTQCEINLQALYDQQQTTLSWKQLDQAKRIHRNLY